MRFKPLLTHKNTVVNRSIPAFLIAIVATFFLVYVVSPAVSQPTQTGDRTPPSITQTPQNYSCNRGASAGYLPTRFQVGMQGHSIHVGALNLRQQPGVESQIVGTLAPESNFTTLAGPACAGNYIWWKVNTGQQQGWVAEGEPSSSVYWLQPDTVAQRPPAPSIELIGNQERSRSYRLTINSQEDILFVYCPINTAPKLQLLSNQDAIGCQPI